MEFNRETIRSNGGEYSLQSVYFDVVPVHTGRGATIAIHDRLGAMHQEGREGCGTKKRYTGEGSVTRANRLPNRPRLTDLLLWLQFLPYCSQYGEVLKQVKEKLNGNQGSNGKQFHERLPMAISHLPMLFLQIEGPGTQRNNGSKQTSSLFLKISELSKCQYIFDQKYYDTNNVVKILLCVFPVIHWGLKEVTQRCSKSNCTDNLTACTETKNLLTSLGWNGSRDSNNVAEYKPIIYENAKCQPLKDYLDKQLLGDNDSIGGMKKILESAWKGTNGQNVSASSGQYLPQTIYEMLVWLMGLPVSEKFVEFKKQNGVSNVMPQFTEILFEVPNLFLTLNGDLSGMLSSMFQCHGISEPSKAYQYGNEGSDCLKIFSAIVAILFPVIRYLQQRCNRNGQAFANGDSWQNTQINADGLKTYLNFAGFQPISSSGMNGQAFHSGVLMKIFGDLTQQNGGTGQLKTLYECAVKAIQSTYQSGSSSGTTTTPTTIRQMMLWLIGLPVTTQYSNGTSSGNGLIQTVTTKAQQINDLKNKITNGQPESLHYQLQHSIVGMMTAISQIEGGLGSVVEFLKDGFKVDNTHHLQYQSGEQLFTQFTTYVTSVHVQLRFLMVMCKTGKDQGGWQECKYANGNTGGTCQCNGNVASCLKDFLQNGNNQGGSGNKFKLCKAGDQEENKMGFNQYPTQNNGSITGDHISTHLELMLDEIPTTQSGGTVEFKKPLSLFTQYCVAIGRIDPVSLGDHFDVFRELAGDMWSKIQEKVKTEIKGITTGDNDGTQASGKLQGALKAVWPDSHNGNPHPSDLASLTGCNGGTGNPCSPFIATLSYGLYKYFKPEVNGKSPPQGPKTHIDWLYMKMSGLYGKLEKLNKTMKVRCDCCLGDKTALCKGLTKCPNCLSQLYKMGLIFGDPVTIGPKNCRELHTKMTAVLDATSTLCLLFTKIEDGRFKPYLLFSAMVVQGKNDKLNGDAYIKTYTLTLGGEYQKHLEAKKEKDKNQADTNKTAREDALKCTCKEHSYNAHQAGTGTATTVTLTLYFKHDRITEVVFQVPHHGPSTNPLVRFYPRNLKSIVDWILRIGQTRLGQDTSEASTKDTGVTEMCKTLWPEIGKCLNDENSKEVFKALIEKVMSLMGLENKGNKEVQKEVSKKLTEVKGNIDKKLKGGNGEEGFQQTFSSILTFKPKEYIDKVIEDFGKQVCNVTVGSEAKNRSYWCVAKAVSKCMKDSLQKIQNLAQTNKTVMANYSVTITEDPTESIDEVSSLTTIQQLKQLCEGFQKFHGVYKTVKGAFSTHLQQAQQGGASTEWTKIKQCVEAFNELGQCVEDLQELDGHNTAGQMPTASQKLGDLSHKLDKVIEKLSDNGLNDISKLGKDVEDFVKQLDENHLKTKGMSDLESALEINNGSSTKFDQLLRYYVSTLITKMKQNSIGDNNNTVCDIHLRVRNDLLQLSECLKVMCEVCSTGMKEFAKELKECVDKGKGHLTEINTTKNKLGYLKGILELFNSGSKFSYDDKTLSEQLHSSITVIHSLLNTDYIYQPQPIVSNFINDAAVQKMTTYLKSLPDLIRDRYVLQKWKDSPEVFCGVQEFKGGIVKQSDITGITTVLKDLLKDTFHDDQQFPITIHEFQVRSLIYNFCHKDGIKGIDSGIKVMSDVTKKMNDKVEWTKIKTNKKTELLPLLTKLSDNAYLKYFATHLRDSRTYYSLCNRWSTHPLYPNPASAKTIYNYIRATH